MRILVCEDNSITADTLTTLLHLEGHAAYFCGDGLSALTHLAAPSEPLPEAIVLDLRMPGMDGAELLERLEQNPEWTAIPVILVTATDLDEQSHLRQRYPRIRVLGKPFDPDVLLDVLKEIEAEQRGEKP